MSAPASRPWPPPPDLPSIQELVRTADIESHLADGAAPDEYEPEEQQLLAAIHHLPTDALVTANILPRSSRSGSKPSPSPPQPSTSAAPSSSPSPKKSSASSALKPPPSPAETSLPASTEDDPPTSVLISVPHSSQPHRDEWDPPPQPELYLREAIAEAHLAEAAGEVPVGAVVVFENQIIARAHNHVITDQDPTAHAEILALRVAGRALGNYRLLQCDLYTTLEPCAMCAGAILHARIRRLLYAAPDPKAGACGSALSVLNHPALNHRVEVLPPVLTEECSTLLTTFFRTRRQR